MITACGDSGSNADATENASNGEGTTTEKTKTKLSFGEMGAMVDSRDGRTYKTVQIGKQLWMAENLAFYDTVWNPEMASKYSIFSSYSSSELSGRKYTYDVAMNFARYDDSLYNDGICPPGWHLPTMEEFDDFKSAVEMKCDSLTYCGFSERGWGEAEDYRTSTSAEYGVRINTAHGYKYESNSNTAVYYSVDIGGYTPFAAGFQGRSAELYVRCLQGSKADSAEALESFKQTRENNIEIVRAAEAELAHIMNGAKNYFNENIEYSYFTDARDSNVYGYLKIGNYTWMAENLRYKVDPYFYMRYRQDSIFYYRTGIAYSVEQKDSVCPDGWHLPTRAEWIDLMSVSEDEGSFMGDDSYWDRSRINVTNSTGFTMLTTSKSFGLESSPFNEAAFWTSDDSSFVRMEIDTVYADDSTDVEKSDSSGVDVFDSASVDDPAMDSLVASDTLQVKTDSLLNVPARSFTLDTTYKEYHYYFIYEYDWIFGFDVVSFYSTVSYVRCVMDY